MAVTTEVPTITVTNQPGDAPHAGRTFVAAIVPPGGRYGRNNVVVNDGEALIEFYDATYADDAGFGDMRVNGRVVGQFTGGRYYVATIMNRGGRPERAAAGLNLDGGIAVWTIDAEAMAEVYAWLDGLYPEATP